MVYGIHGDYKRIQTPIMSYNPPAEIAQLTGYDEALRTKVDQFTPNRFMTVLQHLGAGGSISEAIATNNETHARKFATASKQATLNAQLRSTAMAAHFQRIREYLSIAKS